MKKVIEGYIARYNDDLIFSDQPMKQSGFIGDGGIWYTTIETEEDSPMNLRADMHSYIDIPELTEEKSPRRCTITIEVGDFVGEKIDPEFMEKRAAIRRSVWGLAEGTGKTFDEAKAILSKQLPEITKYLKD